MRASVALVVLSLVMGCVGWTGCGRAARVVSSRGTETVEGVDLAVPREAWFLCERSPELPAGVVRLASYRQCHIVVSEPAEHDAMEARADVALGPALLLEKTDPALLVKALARYDVLHIVLFRSWHAGQVSRSDVERERWEEEEIRRYEAAGLTLLDEVGCPSRGYGFDLDCRPEQLAAVLASRQVFELEPWNRWYARWK